MTRQARPIQDTIKTLLVGIHAPYNHTPDIGAYYDEFISLVQTLGIEYEDIVYFKMRDIDSATFLTKGKLESVRELCKQHAIDQIIISEPISPKQERNIEDLLDVTVIDRTQLILDIFEQAAVSAEGKTQVEIAQLQQRKTRLAGKGVDLAQQKGAIGVRGGSGETFKERETRTINARITALRKQLEHIERTRETQRKKRLERQVPQLCLIGYTNAGKSSILNALTKSSVLAEDKLFATLDTTTRELYVDSKKIGVLSDTVGFIQLLPPKLINAFKSTLSELQYADLLLHVIDISDPLWEDHARIVHTIIDELGIDREMLYVFNKIDKVEITPMFARTLEQYQPNVQISTLTKEGIAPLRRFLYAWEKSIESNE